MYYDISDHLPIFMTIDIAKETKDNEPKYRRIESENNIIPSIPT